MRERAARRAGRAWRPAWRRPTGSRRRRRRRRSDADRRGGGRACSMRRRPRSRCTTPRPTGSSSGPPPGPQGEGVVGLASAAHEGIAGYVFSTGQPLAVADVAADPRFERATAERTGYVPALAAGRAARRRRRDRSACWRCSTGATAAVRPRATSSVATALGAPGDDRRRARSRRRARRRAAARATALAGPIAAPRATASIRRAIEDRSSTRDREPASTTTIRLWRAGRPDRPPPRRRPGRQSTSPSTGSTRSLARTDGGPVAAARSDPETRAVTDRAAGLERGVRGPAPRPALDARPAVRDDGSGGRRSATPRAAASRSRSSIRASKPTTRPSAAGSSRSLRVELGRRRAARRRRPGGGRPRRPRHGLRRDHPRHRAGRRARLDPRPRARTTGARARLRRGPRVGDRAGRRRLNLSLSSRSEAMSGPFHELADRAYFANTLLVCAANNVAGPVYPSLFAAVVSVAAHDVARPRTSGSTTRARRSSSGPTASTSTSPGGAAAGSARPATRSPRRTSPVTRRGSARGIPTASPFEVKTILAATADDPTGHERHRPGRSGRCRGRAGCVAGGASSAARFSGRAGPSAARRRRRPGRPRRRCSGCRRDRLGAPD